MPFKWFNPSRRDAQDFKHFAFTGPRGWARKPADALEAPAEALSEPLIE
jgi:hypothetical protein